MHIHGTQDMWPQDAGLWTHGHRIWGIWDAQPQDLGCTAAGYWATGSGICGSRMQNAQPCDPGCASVGCRMLGRRMHDCKVWDTWLQDLGCWAMGCTGCWTCGGSYLRSWRLSRRTRLWPGSSTPASSRSSSVMSLGMRHKCGALCPRGAPQPPVGSPPGGVTAPTWVAGCSSKLQPIPAVAFCDPQGQWGSPGAKGTLGALGPPRGSRDP